MAQEGYASPSIQASSATHADLLTGGLAVMLAKVVAANPAITNPSTAPTATATGGGASGGNLAAGNYFYSYTWVDGAGETLHKESASALTVASGNIPRVTIPALPTGVCSANIYVSAAGGASGSETLYATGITGTTFDLSFAAPVEAGITIPTANTTGAASILARINAGSAGNYQLLWQRLSDLITQWLSGYPMSFQQTRLAIRHLDYCFALWKQVTKEVLTLMAANPGTLGYVQGATVPKFRRTFP